MLEVLTFPADLNNRIDVFLISNFNKLFGFNLCVLKSR